MFPPLQRGITKHCAIENSSGLVTTVRTDVGVTRLGITSQLAPVSQREAKNPRIHWPLLMGGYRALFLGEKIAIV